MPYLLVGLMWTRRPLPWCESILMVLPLTWQAKLSSFSFLIIIYVSLGSFFDKTCYANHLLTLGWASSSCCPKLGGDCYYLFSNFSAIRGCLPKGLISCWVSASQLVATEEPQVPMDPPPFMLAPFSMSKAKYQLWHGGIIYTNRLLEDQQQKLIDWSALKGTSTLNNWC